MSATGASGLGATNQQEVGMLQNRIRNLNPANKDQFEKDLIYIRNKWKEIIDKYKKRLKEVSTFSPEGSAQRQAEEARQAQQAEQAPPPAKGKMTSTKEGWMKFMRNKFPNKTTAQLEAALRAKGHIQ